MTAITRAVLLGYWATGSDQWHAARSHGLGGSEIAAVLGLSPFESRFSLWHRKVGFVGPVDENPEMEWGKRLEPAILGKFAENHPDLDVLPGPGTWHANGRPWQIANPDALAVDRVVETKLSLFGDGYGEPGTDEVPVYVRTQVLWYLDVFEVFERASVAVLVGGHDYREYVVSYDADEAAMLRTAGERFLAEVAQGIRPDIDEHTATYQTVRELHPLIDGTEVELSNHAAQLFIETKTAERLAKALARQATALVADEMGTAARAVWDGRTVATRRVRDEGIPFVVAARGLSANGDGESGTVGGSWVDPETGETF